MFIHPARLIPLVHFFFASAEFWFKSLMSQSFTSFQMSSDRLMMQVQDSAEVFLGFMHLVVSLSRSSPASPHLFISAVTLSLISKWQLDSISFMQLSKVSRCSEKN